MTFSDLLLDAGVLANLKTTSKKHLFQELARAAAPETGVNARDIFDALMERERLGSTGVGFGVAIPHARLAGISRVMGVFAKLEGPIDVDAIDEQPADLVFMLLAPDEGGVDHLKALARVSRAFRRPEFRDKLRGTNNVDALRALLTDDSSGDDAKNAKPADHESETRKKNVKSTSI